MSPRSPLPSPFGSARPLRAAAALLVPLLLTGCPYLGEQGYTDKVRDVDGDGLVAERFGGIDCNDADPKVGDCDADDDGYRSVSEGGEDCDDDNALIHPDGAEVCDGVDNDCDGLVDNDDELVRGPTVWRDADGDSWGTDEGILWCGDAPSGYAASTRDGDCDDADDLTFPGAAEDCAPVDRNCDGDPTLGAADGSDWFADLDGDGHGAGSVLASSCEAPSSDLVDSGDDCAPSDASVNPSATEVPYNGIDDDCDGGDLTDVDGDGDEAISVGGADCNDNDIAVNSSAIETCNGIDDDCDGGIDEGLILTTYPDSDGDGFGDPLGEPLQVCGTAVPAGRADNNADCDDNDTNINPSIAELCDNVDNDCDGEVDGTSATDAVTRWADADGDLYGDPLRPITTCEDDLPLDVRWIDNDLDCDDSHETANPGGIEVCDGLDNNCSGLVDDGDDRIIFFTDSDGDGFGDGTQPIQACVSGEGLSRLSTDCNDSDPTAYPGAVEVCGDAVRQDCSTALPEDCDGDGETDIASGGVDCDDTNPSIGTFATEVCDGLDNDCDGDFDDADSDVVLATRADWYEDQDGDGVGSPLILAADQCSPPADSVRITGDCDDEDPNRTPGAVETCDEVDNDCDGLIDEDVSNGTSWYADTDGDGFGEQGTAPVATQCEAPPQPSADNDSDCNDALAVVSPDAVELCDGIDNDCDGLIDDADPDVLLTLWFLDEDGDGYGNEAESLEACEAPTGYVVDGGDCDDTRADRAPGADELCDNLDNDCDGLVDGDDPDETEPSTWYADLDGDGFGDPGDVIQDCLRPNGYVSNGDDCDDGSDLVRPGALELCDGVDNDCDGVDDEAAVDASIWFYDEDGDTWGDLTRSTLACSQPSDHVPLSGDCDDDDAAVRPGAQEVCGDGLDNDCNGLVDGEDPGADPLTWYPDGDGDGAGDATASGVAGCDAPAADPLAFSILWAPNNLDCDDTNPTIGPHADEVCDLGIDNDCDGLVDSDDDDVDAPRRFLDSDGDGYGVGSGTPRCELDAGWADVLGDCNDGDAAVSPDAAESCNGLDDDCDGDVDDNPDDGGTWILDADGDGFYQLSAPQLACVSPGPDWQLAVGREIDDCDDTRAFVHVGAPEVCDGVDNDCNGAVDETGGLAWSVDLDGDGYGDRDTAPILACTAPAGFVSNALDCLDSPADDFPGVDPASVRPGQLEQCNGIDDDCDDATDEDAVDAVAYYVDADSDGIAPLDAATVWSCVPSEGLTTEIGDCDDSNPAVSPNATEQCGTPYDDDCNGLANDDDVYALGGGTFFADFDGDGHGRSTLSRTTCSAPAGYVASSDDCDDAAAHVNPGAPEICDGIDDDCDGGLLADENDIDGDGYVACADYIENGAGLQPGDCGEGNADVFPGAPEQCNQIDDDCNTLVDDLVSNLDYWPDGDGDGFGDGSTEPVSDCLRPDGYVGNDGDCNDLDIAVNPLANESAGDNVDQNCDGVENCYADGDDDGFRGAGIVAGGFNSDADCDDPFEAVALDPADCNDADELLTVDALWYADCDNDGEPRSAGIFACGSDDATASYAGCSDSQPPDGGTLATQGSDCNDEDPSATTTGNFYPDCDGDGFASSDTRARVTACGISGADAASTCSDGHPPDGGWRLSIGPDCDDEDAAVRPTAGEIPGDEIDQNCDAIEICWADGDGDGARSDAATVDTAPGDLTCDEAGTAPSTTAVDCNDADPTGQIAEDWYADCDGDTVSPGNAISVCGAGQATSSHRFFTCGGSDPVSVSTSAPTIADCNDADAFVFPGAPEQPGDHIDQDCDDIELCFHDADNDGARLLTTFPTVFGDTDCLGAFEGQLSDVLDCDDTNPLAFEVEDHWVDCDNDATFDPSSVNACGAPAPAAFACDNPGALVVSGSVPTPFDCDDTDTAIFPGAGEQPGDEVDQNCDTIELCWRDDDDDGYRSSVSVIATAPGDLTCDETFSAPDSAPIDCNDADPTGQLTEDWYADCDGDTWFAAGRVSSCGEGTAITAHAFITCFGPDPVAVTNVDPGSYDCDEVDPTVNPAGTEQPGDHVDEDCSDTVVCYVDDDDDGFRLTSTFETAPGDTNCFEPQEGETADGLDCNDADPFAFQDEDFFIDCDVDGHFEATPLNACGFPVPADFGCGNPGGFINAGYAPAPYDCNDLDASIRPGGFETPADGIDQNCDGGDDCWTDGDNDGVAVGIAHSDSVDLDCDDPGEGTQAELDAGPDCNDADPVAFMFDFYSPDCDDDGVAGFLLLYACGEADADAQNPCPDSQPPDGGYTQGEPGTDCNDDDPTAITFTDFYPDCDNDGSTSNLVVNACGEADANAFSPCADVQPPDGGWAPTSDDDCDDEDPGWFLLQDWYPDCDGDGAFDAFSVGQHCTLAGANGALSACIGFPLDAAGFAHTFPTSSDCNDTLAAVFPGAPEVCDGWANNCDSPTLPFDEYDDDFDGFIECGPYVENGRFLGGGDDCLDEVEDPVSAAVYPGQIFDIAVDGYGLTLQQTIDLVCDNAVVYPDFYATYEAVTLPSTKSIRLDNVGRGAQIQTFAGSPAVTAVGTPAGTEVAGFDLMSFDEYAVDVSGGGELILRGISVYGSGETDEKGVAVNGATVEIIDSVFDSTGANEGSAVLATNGADVTLRDTQLFNTVGFFDAPVKAIGSTLTLTDVHFENSDILNAGLAATAVSSSNSILTMTKVRAGYGYSTDRQPAVLISGGTADLEDVYLLDNPGGLWLTGTAVVTAKRLTLERSGGNEVFDNHEGAIELRNTATLTATNVVAYGSDGPGIHLRDNSDLTLDYATLVANRVAGIELDTGNQNLEMSHIVFWDQATDVEVDATYTSATNHVLRLEHGLSTSLLCDVPASEDCVTTTDPEFITWFGTLDSSQWLLRPDVGSTLWNGALAPSDPSFDPLPIVGHAGGFDASPGWYDDTDIDGLYDGWELHWFRWFTAGFDLSTLATGGDWDIDGVMDDEEYTAGTNPDNYDTDFDGADDDYDYAPLDCSLGSYYGGCAAQ